MGLKAGIVGIPNVGKSTLFNAITNSQVEAANYPFATIEPNKGIVELADHRLEAIAKIVNPQKIVKSTFEFVDIAGLVKGASQGEGLGNKFLANIREVDAIIHVVRCFQNDDIAHVQGQPSPIRDVEIVNHELLLADYETINHVCQRLKKQTSQKQPDRDIVKTQDLAFKIKQAFEAEKNARDLTLSASELKIAKGWHLLTLKPMIYIGNIAEKYLNTPLEAPLFQTLADYGQKNNAIVLPISAQIESEIAQLNQSDRQLFMQDLGIKESGLNQITRAAFTQLGLQTYFTAGPKEVHSWTFRKDAKAPECAGIIHSDFEDGFIKAAIVSYDDFIQYQGEKGAKLAGKYRLEGKDYFMQDGDIVEFRFNK